jgi:hypothetical protein
MPVCCVCEGDGVLEALGTWYCTEHVEEAVIDVVIHVANIRGWDPEDSANAVADWLAS